VGDDVGCYQIERRDGNKDGVGGGGWGVGESGYEMKMSRSLFFILPGKLNGCHHVNYSLFSVLCIASVDTHKLKTSGMCGRIHTLLRQDIRLIRLKYHEHISV